MRDLALARFPAAQSTQGRDACLIAHYIESDGPGLIRAAGAPVAPDVLDPVRFRIPTDNRGTGDWHAFVGHPSEEARLGGGLGRAWPCDRGSRRAMRTVELADCRGRPRSLGGACGKAGRWAATGSAGLGSPGARAFCRTASHVSPTSTASAAPGFAFIPAAHRGERDAQVIGGEPASNGPTGLKGQMRIVVRGVLRAGDASCVEEGGRRLEPATAL